MRFINVNERRVAYLRLEELLREAARIENEIRNISIPEIIDDKLRVYSRIKKNIQKNRIHT